MRKSDKHLYHLVLVGCVLGSLSLTAQADNGIIIIKRDVQVRNATIPLIPDPSPTTVNANPSAYVLKQTNELSDGDFASISSGAGISNMITQQTNNLGGNLGNQNQLPNLSGGRGTGGSGNGISNMVNSSVQRGLAPLQILTGGGK